MSGAASRFVHLALGALLGTLAVPGGGPLRALDITETISQYGHTAWTSQNGVPGEAVYQVLQTPNGYLWLRTSVGLVRFDGVRFVPIEPEVDGEPVRDPAKAMCLGAEGDLLVRGQLTTLRYHEGVFSHYLPRTPLKIGDVRVVYQTSDQQVWIGSDNYVHTAGIQGIKTFLTGTGWIFALHEDRQGTLWVGAANGFYRFPRDPARDGQRELSGEKLLGPSIQESVNAFAEDQRGNLWIGTHSGLQCWVGGKPAAERLTKELAGQQVNALLEDRKGNLWVGTSGAGLYRLTQGRWTFFNKRDGLTDNNVLSLCEDREGTLWVGTQSGLDRFRDTKFLTLTMREGLCANETGAVLVFS